MRSIGLAVLGVGVALMGALAIANDGVVDVEVRNRTCVVGSLRQPDDLETFRLRVPAGAALTIDVRGSRRAGVMSARVFDEDDQEVDAGAFTTVARGARLDGFPVNATGLYRVDVRGDGERTGTYRAQLFWAAPREAQLDATIDGAPVEVSVLAAEKSRARVRLVGGGVRLTRVTGPDGFELDFPTGASRRRLRRLPLGSAGTYVFTFDADEADTALAGALTVTTRTRCPAAEPQEQRPPAGRCAHRRPSPRSRGRSPWWSRRSAAIRPSARTSPGPRSTCRRARCRRPPRSSCAPAPGSTIRTATRRRRASPCRSTPRTPISTMTRRWCCPSMPARSRSASTRSACSVATTRATSLRCPVRTWSTRMPAPCRSRPAGSAPSTRSGRRSSWRSSRGRACP